MQGDLLEIEQDFSGGPSLQVGGSTTENIRGNATTHDPIVVPPAQQASNACSKPILGYEGAIMDVVGSQPSIEGLDRSVAYRALVSLVLENGLVFTWRNAIFGLDSPPVRRFPGGPRVLVVSCA